MKAKIKYGSEAPSSWIRLKRTGTVIEMVGGEAMVIVLARRRFLIKQNCSVNGSRPLRKYLKLDFCRSTERTDRSSGGVDNRSTQWQFDNFNHRMT